MKSIWKYELTQLKSESLMMPEGSKFLHVAVQNLKPCVWALVETDAPLAKRQIRIFGTGWEIEEDIADLKYVGTWQLAGMVFHLFEVIETGD